MSPCESYCPYEPANRASRCQSCLDANGTLTPCVKNWLQAKVRGEVLPVVSIERVRARKRAA